MTSGLWPSIISPASLHAAFDRVAKNSGGAGGDGVTIGEFRKNLHGNLQRLSTQLEESAFRHGECRKVYLARKNGGQRRLMIPPVADRIVHTSIATHLSPILDKTFEDSSFAYRPGRSVARAVRMIERWRDEGFRIVIEADINSYFDHVLHQPLMEMLKRALAVTGEDQGLFTFLSDGLAHQATELDQTGKGLVQGSPLSPLLANLYLDGLDEKMTSKGVRIVRFADDFVILCKSEDTAHKSFDELRQHLSNLGLTLHTEKTKLVDFQKSFEFLGHVFVRNTVVQKWPRSGSVPSPLSPTNRRLIVPPSQETTEEGSFPVALPKSAVDPEDMEGSRIGRDDYAKGERTLYVKESGRSLTVSGQLLCVQTAEGRELMAIPRHAVHRIVVGQSVEIARSVLDCALSGAVRLTFATAKGETWGRIAPRHDSKGQNLVRQASAAADSAFALKIAQSLVRARITSQRVQLSRLNRNLTDDLVQTPLQDLMRILKRLPLGKTLNEVRGLEGASGARYWKALGSLCRIQDKAFIRSRPARDPLNATINYLTFLLEQDVRASVTNAGLHSGVGFLHASRNGNDALVYDLMEPFRAPLTEGLAVYLFNARRLRIDMFDGEANSVPRMNRQAVDAVITAYEHHVARQTNVPWEKGKLAWRRAVFRQSQVLAKAIRKNDATLFLPFTMEM